MTLTILRGLPASGKSMWATQESLLHGKVVVTKDDIRRQLKAGGWVWSREAERRDVETRRDSLIEQAFQKGKDVISADTNLAEKHVDRLEDLARKWGAQVEIRKFVVSPEECIRRDALREGDAKVGAYVIWKMASSYYDMLDHPVPQRVERRDDLQPALLCDLDGTLALFEGKRSPYDAGKAADDDVCLQVRDLLMTYYKYRGWSIVYLSGRDSEFRTQTEEFLRKNHCPQGPLHMRPHLDRRKDYLTKLELFNHHVRGKWDVRGVVDDRPQVLRMWRQIGLFTFAVGPLEEF